MTLRVWKHLTVVGAAIAGIGAVVAGLMEAAVVSGIGTAIGIVFGAARYFLGVAEDWTKRRAARAKARRAGPVARSEAITVPATAGETEPHDEITEAFEYVAQGRPDITIERLTKLKQRRWDQLSDRARYRLLANRGSAKLVGQDKPGAAKDYIHALDYQPSDEDARAFAALGRLLLGDVEQARELAAELCRDHPMLIRAQVVRIRTAPQDISLGDLRESVPSAVRSAPDVVLALHDRALEDGLLADAEEILREYPESTRGWLPTTLALASTVLQRELNAMRVTLEGPVVSDRERLSEAIDLITAAIGRIPQGDPEGLAFGAYMNRGVAQTLLREHRLAEVDFRTAYQLKPSDEQALLGLAKSLYLGRREPDEGIVVLERHLAEHASNPAELLLAELLRQREGAGDLDRAAEIFGSRLEHLGRLEDEEQRVGAVEALSDIYLRTGRGELALGVIEKVPSDVLGSVAQAAIRGNALRRLGRKDDAIAEARRARDALHESSTPVDVERVALLLESLEEYEEAFGLWRRIVPPDFVSPETYYLLHCAQEAGHHQFVLEFCQELRARGQLDRRCLGYEIEVLIEYGEFARARGALLGYLKANPQDKIARLNWAILALRYGWKDEIGTGSLDLPTVGELDNPEIGERVVDFLRAGPNPTEAVDYAYELYRQFPDQPEAHRALITAVLAPGPTGLHIDTPKAVAPGTAVCYSEVDSEARRWVVVEDSDNPSLTRGEYPISHPLIKSMLGKAVGDVFPLSGAGVRESMGTILDIRDKRVYRSNELVEGWRERFPDLSFLVPIPVKASDTPSPTDFAEIEIVMKRLTEQRENAEKAYVDGRLPIATFALFTGQTVFETMHLLSASRDLPVRACRGSAIDFDGSFQGLDQAELVVLDPAALATLVLVEEVRAIEVMPFRCLLTERALQELRDLSRDDLAPAPVGYMGYRNGRLRIEEVDPEREAADRERLREIVSALERSCEIVGGSDLARLDAAKRQQLVRCVASASLQAAAVASERGAVLWTDDHLLHELLKGDLPSARVWTQAVFRWLLAKGLIEREPSSRVAARMLRFGYVFTSLDSKVVLDTCEAAAWRTEDPDLAAVLAEFGNATWEHEIASQIVGQTLGGVWRDAPTVEHARAITARLLTHLADRQDHRRIIRHVLHNVASLLGLATTRVGPFRETLTAFLRGGAPTL